MRRPARPLFPVVLLALCGLAVGPGRGAAQNRIPRVPPNGTQAFRLILHGSGLTPLQTPADLESEPHKTLVIVFGKLDPLVELTNELKGGLRGYLENGGAILVASDRTHRALLLNELYRFRPVPDVVRNPDPQNCYRGQDLCPYVTEFLADHPLFRNVKTLATNAPTYLVRDEQGWVPPVVPLRLLAAFPRGCQNNDGLAFRGNPLFAVGDGRLTGGTNLLLAGHGVFMNGMMAHRDNIFFARNCVDWFTKDKKGNRQRTRVLFYEEGRIVAKFNVPLVELPPPPMPPLEKLNRLLAGLEDENFFNKAALTLGRERLIRWGTILLTFLLGLYGLRRIMRGRHQAEVGVYLTAGAVARDVSAETLIAQRHHGLIDQQNLWETARELARECFALYTARAAAHPPRMPRAVIREGVRQGALTRQVRDLWRLAHGGEARRISAAQLNRTAADARAVREALASGALVLQEPPPDTPHPVRRPAGAADLS